MKNLVDQFIKSNRNYRHDMCNSLIVEKVWNHGMGSLDLFRFYPEKKTICINRCLFNSSDERKLKEFCRDAHIENWERVFVSFGYPEYYRYNLHLPNIGQMIEKFVSEYSQYDSRLKRINRKKVCAVNHGDHYYLSCVFYGKKYGQCYPI